jgi:hypothetical protein
MLKADGDTFDKAYDWMLLPPTPSRHLVENLMMRLPVIPNEEIFMKEQLELYEREIAEKENIENILRSHVESSIAADSTNIPLGNDLKPPKECLIFW